MTNGIEWAFSVALVVLSSFSAGFFVAVAMQSRQVRRSFLRRPYDEIPGFKVEETAAHWREERMQ